MILRVGLHGCQPTPSFQPSKKSKKQSKWMCLAPTMALFQPRKNTKIGPPKASPPHPACGRSLLSLRCAFHSRAGGNPGSASGPGTWIDRSMTLCISPGPRGRLATLDWRLWDESEIRLKRDEGPDQTQTAPQPDYYGRFRDQLGYNEDDLVDRRFHEIRPKGHLYHPSRQGCPGWLLLW